MVSVVNALDNTGQVELTLLPSGAGKLALRELSRTPVVEPALVTARIELPDGADTSAPSIAATLFASASQAGANPPAPYALTLEKVGERTYESPRVLVVRSTAPLPAALAGTAVVAVAGAGDSLTLRSGAVPGHTDVVQASLAPRAVPQFLGQDVHGDFVAKDSLEPGDTFTITYTPSQQSADVTSITVLVGALADGGVNPAHAVTLTLAKVASSPGSEVSTYVSTVSVKVVLDPSAATSADGLVLFLPAEGAPIGIEVVSESDAYRIPVVQEILREVCVGAGSTENLPEAMSGSSPQTGQGVYVHNQEQVLRLDLHTVPAVGLDYQLAITHRSRIRYLSAVGDRWVHNYDLRILPTDTGAQFYSGDGRVVEFTRVAERYVSEAGAYLELTRSGGKWTLTHPDRTVMTFRAVGAGGFDMIERIEDTNANALTFRYDLNGLLLEVQDPYGRAYSYLYNDHRQLKTVVDFAGREISFERLTKPFDVLAAVLLPEVTSESLAPGAEGQTRGRITFGYDGAKRLERASTHRGVLFVNRYQTADCGRIESQEIGEPAYTVQIARSGLNATVTRGTLVQSYNFDAKTTKPAALPANRVTVPSVITVSGTVSGTSPETTALYYNHELEVIHLCLPRTNVTELEYDDLNPDRRARGNLVTQTQYPLEDQTVSAAWEAESLPGHAHVDDVHARLRDALARTRVRTGGPIVTSWRYHAKFNTVKQTVLPDRTVIDYEYDEARGNLTKVLLPTGTTRTPESSDPHAHARPERVMTYNRSGQLLTVTDEELRVTRHSYYTIRHIGGVPQVGGDVGAPLTYLASDRGGYLGRIEDLTRVTVTYHGRDERGNLTALVEPRGVMSKWTYTSRDLVLEHRPAAGLVTYEGIDGTGMRLPAGERPTYAYRYDGDGNRALVRTSAGSTAPGAGSVDATQSYDALRRPLQQRQQLDVAHLVTSPEAAVTTNAYRSADGLLDTTTDPVEDVVRFHYDAKLRLERREHTGPLSTSRLSVDVHFGYDPNGNAIREQVGATSKATWTFYDGFDRPLARLDPSGALTLHVLDAMGRPVESEVWGETQYLDDNALSLSERFRHNYGLLSSVQREYYKRGWLAKEKVDTRCYEKAAASPERRTFTSRLVRETSYNRVGEVVLTTSAPFGSTLAMVYNDHGRLEHVHQYDDGGKLPAMTTTFAYDKAGNVVTETVALARGPTYTTSRAFDWLSRLAEEDPHGTYDTTELSYDFRGNVVSNAGPLGVEIVEYDLGNRELSRTVNGRVMMRQTWRQNGQIESQTDPREKTTRYEYVTGRTERIVNVDDGFQLFEYEPGTGKLVQHTVRGGTRFGITMDDAGRVIRREVESLSEVDRLLPWALVGAGVQTFRFDALGRLTVASEEVGPLGESSTVYRTYDGLGRGCHEGQVVELATGSALYTRAYSTTEGQSKVERLVSTDHFDGESPNAAEGDPKDAHSEVRFASAGVSIYHGLTRGGHASGWKATRTGAEALMLGSLELRTDGLPLGYSVSGASLVAPVSARITYNDERRVESFLLRGEGHETLETFKYGPKTGLLSARSSGPTDPSGTSTSSTAISEYRYLGEDYPHELIDRTTSSLAGPYKLIAGRETTKLRLPNQLVSEVAHQKTEVGYGSDGELDKRGVQRELDRGGVGQVERAVFEPTAVNGLNQIREVTQTGTTIKEAYLYSAAGNVLQRFGTEARNVKLTWDPYNRLRKVTGDVERIEQVGTVGGKRTGAPIFQRVRRVIECHFAYTALHDRVLKISSTTRTTTSDTTDGVTFTQRIHLVKWAHHARGTVVEDDVIHEVEGERVTVHHHVFLDSGGQHMGVLRYDAKRVASGVIGTTDAPKKMFALMRDGTHTVRGIVDAVTGRRVEDLNEGFAGDVTRIPGDADPTKEPPLTYDYLAGGEVDAETGLNLIEARYMLPDLQRWISVGPMGLYFDPSTYGNAYEYAGGNPLIGRTFSGPFGLSAKRDGQGPTPDQNWGAVAKTLHFLGVVGGAAFVSAGVPLLATPLAPLGALMVLYGADSALTGSASLRAGRHEQSGTSKVIQGTTGISREWADLADAGVGLALGGASGLARRGAGAAGAAEEVAEGGVRATRGGAGLADEVSHSFTNYYNDNLRIFRQQGINPLRTRIISQEIRRSAIGRTIWQAAADDLIHLELSGEKVAWSLLGRTSGTQATVYIRNTQSYALTVETLIHEGVHALGVGGSRRAEALARLAEHAHRGQGTSHALLRGVLQEMRHTGSYGHLPWRAGRTSPHFPGVNF